MVALLAIRAERRIDFELRLLVEIADAIRAGYSTKEAPDYVALRVSMLRSRTLPSADDWMADDVEATAAWRRYQDGQPQSVNWPEWVGQQTVADVKAATRRLLDERSAIPLARLRSRDRRPRRS